MSNERGRWGLWTLIVSAISTTLGVTMFLAHKAPPDWPFWKVAAMAVPTAVGATVFVAPALAAVASVLEDRWRGAA